MGKSRSELIHSMVEATKNLRKGIIREQEYIIYNRIIDNQNTKKVNEIEK